MSQAQTRLQGVSASIFSLSAVDMDRRSRKKSLEVLRAKEADVRLLLDNASEIRDRGTASELLALLGKCVSVPTSIASRSDPRSDAGRSDTARSENTSLSMASSGQDEATTFMAMVMMPL